MSMLTRLFRSGISRPTSPSTAPLLPKLSTSLRNVLHVGCGMPDPEKLPQDFFPRSEWNEIRLDIDKAVEPDILASITGLSMIPDGCFDAVFSSHNLEHLYPHEVALALSELLRVLKPDGFALILLPDLQATAELVAQDRLEEPAYISAAGPIAPIDMIFGFRPALAAGNHFMAHRTGFTASILAKKMSGCGFFDIEIQRIPECYALQAIGYRRIKHERNHEFAR